MPEPIDLKKHGHLAHYSPAVLRGVGPVGNTGWLCVSLLVEGEVQRLRLPAADAVALVEAAGRYLVGAGYAVQSPTSSLKFMLDGSPQDGQLHVPLDTSSTACCAERYEPKCSSPQNKCQRLSVPSFIQHVPRAVVWLYVMLITVVLLGVVGFRSIGGGNA